MNTPAKKWDALVLGSGQGGTPLARKLAKAGFQTALIEKGFVGGTCINIGCTPTKAMISDARLAYLVREAPARGIEVNAPVIQLSRIMRRKNGIVEMFRGANERGLLSAGVTLIRGEASFSGPKTVLVNGETHTAEHIFINTGCTSLIPPIPGMDKVPYLTSTGMLELTEVPQRLVVLGGGYIAVEMGQLFCRLGSQVTIVERSGALLGREDEDTQMAVKQILEEEGMQIVLNATVTSVEAPATVVLADGKTLKGSHLLVATGRGPTTAALKLDQTGVETDAHGFIKVDEFLKTNVPGIYAIGDVKGGPAFTHISYNDYLIVYRNLVEKGNLSTRGRLVPYCVFMDPQLGGIGLTEKEAKAQGLSYRTAVLPMTSVARAVETGNIKGFMKAIVDSNTHRILGASILGEEGGEIMTILQMAMAADMPYERIRDMVFAHPLYAESLNNLFMTLDK
jgi:pyruvate/2-oxoglutarate dehydrogenase complex dihydrolipoamide dehydrogenase (E3) component